eukprot:GHVT01038494.1.p1 GENE.GHVT01038494.1~~GHVT01038494.1.p1  ORF type:complete len:163 (+),score=5.42 GHVT01038494.1:112-600(+)
MQKRNQGPALRYSPQMPRMSFDGVPLSLRHGELCKATEKTFEGDIQAQSKVLSEVKNLVRLNPYYLDVEKLKTEMTSATELVRYYILQARLNPETSSYRVNLRDDHVERGDVIKLDAVDWVRLNAAMSKTAIAEPQEARLGDSQEEIQGAPVASTQGYKTTG